jgi:hypothetical protein
METSATFKLAVGFGNMKADVVLMDGSVNQEVFEVASR